MRDLRSVLSTDTESDTNEPKASQISERKRKSEEHPLIDEYPKQQRLTPSTSQNSDQLGHGDAPVFNRGENIYSDRNVDVMVRAIEHQRHTRFRAEDHLYQVNIVPRRRHTLLLLSLETAIKEALTSILIRFRSYYSSNLHHQVYITIIENNIVHGLNTGNYDLNAPPGEIVNRALTILHSYLKSNQTMNLTNSFKIQIKVLSHNHTNFLQATNPRFQKKMFRDFSRIRN